METHIKPLSKIRQSNKSELEKEFVRRAARGYDENAYEIKSFLSLSESKLLKEIVGWAENKKDWSTIGGERYIKVDDLKAYITEALNEKHE